ncbi:TniQ family protein [Paraburkholderia xenovorans]
MKGPFRSRLPGGWPEDAPPRSILFSLPPYGCSGEDRECLGSYVTRLGIAHNISRWTLAYRIIGPAAQELFDVDPGRMARDIGRAGYVASVSSLTEVTYHWAHALNGLTLRTNLQVYTLLPLRGLVSPLKLMSSKKRFCPGCYKEDQRMGRDRYERLLWHIDAVVACPLHKTRLVEVPEQKRNANSGNQADAYQAKAEMLDLESTPLHPASDYEAESARLVAELLDDALFFPDCIYSPSAQSAFLNHAIHTLFEGKSAYFAAHLRVGKSQMYGWAKGDVRMSLPRLALTAYCCGCAIADILLGNRVMLSLRPAPECQSVRLIESGVTGARRPMEELRAELAVLIRGGDLSSASQAAATIGVSRKFFRKNFPTENALVIQQSLERAEALRIEARVDYDQLYLVEHNSLRHAGIYPARRRVVECMRGKVKNLGRHQDAQRAQLKAHAATGVRLAGRAGRLAGSPRIGQPEERV